MNLYITFLGLMFLLKLPPFYLLPVINVLYVSHTFVKISLLFISTFLVILNKNSLKVIKQYPIIYFLILLFLITQTASVLPVIDANLFLKSYHNVILSLIIFYLSSYFVVENKTNHIRVFEVFMFYCGVFFVCFELYSIFFQQTFIDFFKQFFQKEVVDAYLVNIDRNRFSFESNLELFIPFFLIPIINKHRVKIGSFFIVILMICLSILSNNRTRFFAMFFAVIFSFLFARKAATSNKIFIIAFILILSVFSYTVISRIFSPSISSRINIIERINPQEGSVDYESYKFRIDAFIKSIKISFTYPLGLGLGNYYIFSQSKNTQGTQPTYIKNYYDQIKFSPHNIFAQLLSETGIPGCVSFIFLFIYFILSDLKIFLTHSNQNNMLLFSSIVASWVVFIPMLFNPPQTLFINGWFWFLRGGLLTYSTKTNN